MYPGLLHLNDHPPPPARSDSLLPGPVPAPGQPGSLDVRRRSLPADLLVRQRSLRARRWSLPVALEARLRGPLASLPAAAVPSSRESLPGGAGAAPPAVAPVDRGARPKTRGRPKEEVPAAAAASFEVIVDMGAREIIANAAQDARQDEQATPHLQFVEAAFPIPRGEHFLIEALEGGPPFPPMRFQREGMLGVGGNGVVFEAVHSSTGIAFAMKMPRVEDKGTAAKVAGFRRLTPEQRKRLVESVERRIPALLEESSIGVRLFKGRDPVDVLMNDRLVIPVQTGARIQDKAPLFLCAGMVLVNHLGIYPSAYASIYTLVTQVVASRRLKEELGRQMIQAMAMLEKNGWLHGDIKTDNFFIFTGGHVALGDLASLVRAVDAKGKPVVTDCSKRLDYGSPVYFPPELADCLRRQSGTLVRTPSAEWWSLGVSLYEMFCDMRIPFNLDPVFDKSLALFFDALREFRLVKPTLTFENCDIGNDWQNIIRGLLEIDPRDRTSPSSLLQSAPGVVRPKASAPAETEGEGGASATPSSVAP